MTDCYRFHAGSLPLLVSIPHDGRNVPPDIEVLMSPAGRALPDTDWHVARLYKFAQALGAAVISAEYSRYVVDLNRPADDAALYDGQLQTGLCPLRTFSGADIYAGNVSLHTADRVQRYWRPYHDKIKTTLAQFVEQHGHALLWDAHSIKSQVPSLFDGQLAVLNVGTWGGRSCSEYIANAVFEVAKASNFSAVLNGRFEGGYITRYYGQPAAEVHAIQLELSQRAYMEEDSGRYDESRGVRLKDSLAAMLTTFIDTAGEKTAIMR